MKHLSFQINFEGRERNTIIINFCIGESIEAIADSIYTRHPQRLTYTDCIVVRFISPPPSGLPHAEILKSLIDRAPKAAIFSLFLENYTHIMSENLNPISMFSPLDEWPKNKFIRLLREEEMYKLLITSSALLKSNEKFIFRSPSKQYCSAFLRIGNIQVSAFQVDSIFFWLMPFMKDVQSIITDTWSISSIALNIGRRLQLYNEEQSRELNIQMLSHYYDGSHIRRTELENILREATANGHKKTLFLISTVLTGSSLNKFQNAVNLASIPKEMVEFIALYYFDKGNPTNGLCNLTSDNRSITINTWAEPPPEKTVVDIDSCTYSPLQMEEKCISISINDDTKHTKEFFNTYQGTNSISLHRNSKDINQQMIRHHFLYVDVKEMLKVTHFMKKLDNVLAGIKPIPALIIVPPHEAGLALLEYANNYYKNKSGNKSAQLVHPDLDFNDEVVLNSGLCDLCQNDNILIIDDVTTTGTRLSNYQQHLRDSAISFKGKIHYVIGVSRPPSKTAWKRRVRDLEYRDGFSKTEGEHHKVIAIESLVLPDWDEHDCPWCHEEADLDQLLKADTKIIEGDIISFIQKRLRVLINARNSKGLINDAVWRNEQSCHPRMTENSIFFDEQKSTDADIIAAASAAIQSLRKSGELGSSYPYVAVLDNIEYLGNTYNDLIIKLALLRVCKNNELVRWKDAEEKQRIKSVEILLDNGVDKRDENSLYLEVGLNILSGKKWTPKFGQCYKVVSSLT